MSGVVLRLGGKPKTDGQRGLPKPELAEATLSAQGVLGDYNHFRQTSRAGDPDMAILLMPVETLDDLNREGWPVRPGDLGENVTTHGVAYADLAPPRRLRVGGAVLTTTKPCTPCDNLYALPYVGSERGPAFLKTTLGRRGWFARVDTGGGVRRGDRIDLLP
jgi:MOSC domain-containing protein YiiM